MSDVLAINVPICWFCGREFPGRINNLRLHQKKAHGWAPPPEVCRIGGCGVNALSNGYCSMHKSRILRYGDAHYDPDSPEARFWRYLPEDRGEGCWEWTGARTSGGYGAIKVDGAMVPDRTTRFWRFLLMAVLALNVDQPFASLLAHGVTNWLTAAEPPPDGVTDAEWLIVSDDDCDITEPTVFGDFEVWPGDPPGQLHPNHDTERPLRLYPNKGRFFGTWVSLPLGAVLGVGRVTDVVPIVPHAGCRNGSPHVCIGSYGMLAHSKLHEPWPDGETEHDISDQLPYGDWSPGRWAWRMEVRGLTEPVTEYPACPFGCVASGTIHECSPESRALCVEPVRGRQGVWRPDPALVAAVREVPDAN